MNQAPQGNSGHVGSKQGALHVGVVGGTGFVGRHIVRRLLDAGHSVRVLVRGRASAAKLPDKPSDDPSRLQVVMGDPCSPEDLQSLLRGCDACVHAMGILREDKRVGSTFQRVHVDATRCIVRECEALGVGRLVLISAMGVRPAGVSDYQKTKFEGEQLVRNSSLAWTILRPSLVHGLGSEFVRMAQDWCTGNAQPYLFLPYFAGTRRVALGGERREAARIAPIAVEDVAEAVARALRNDASVGETYNLCGSETLTWPEMLSAIKERTPGALPGVRPFGVPVEIAAFKAKVLGLVGMGHLLPFDEGMARMGAEDSVCDMTKATEDLGLHPVGFRESFASYAHEHAAHA